MSQQLAGLGSPSASNTGMHEPFVICPTFRDNGGDIVLVSSDNIEFRVHKNILSLSSEVFRNMFQHPQPPSARVDTVPWPEPAFTVDHLLRLVYPIPKPPVASVDQCILLLQAADKWQIDVAVSLLRRELVQPQFLAREPLKVYGFASFMGYEEEKQIAMPMARVHDPCRPAVRDQVSFMSALDLLRLVHLRNGRSPGYVQKSLESPDTPTPAFVRSDFFDDSDADLILESTDGFHFLIHKQLFRLASPVFRKMLQGIVTRPSTRTQSPLTISLPEAACVIQDFLYFIYPVEKPDSHRTLDDVMSLINAAAKYEIGIALWHLKQELTSDRHLDTKPLKIYGFACRMGLEDVKTKALPSAARSDPLLHRIEEDFQDMTAADLLKLVDYRNWRDPIHPFIHPPPAPMLFYDDDDD